MKKIALLIFLCFSFASSAFAFRFAHIIVKNTGNQTISFYFPESVWKLNIAPGKCANAFILQSSGTVYLSLSSHKQNLVSCGQYHFSGSGEFDGGISQTPFGGSLTTCSFRENSSH